MKLWLLKLLPKTASRVSRYDVMRGCIVAAETEEEARVIASASKADEGIPRFGGIHGVWESPEFTSCELIGTAEGFQVRHLVLRDFNAG